MQTRGVWIPRDAAEIEQAARAGNLAESPSFDAKAKSPAIEEKRRHRGRRSSDVDRRRGAALRRGGERAGPAERPLPDPPWRVRLIGSVKVIATSISEVPYVDVREYPTAADPAVGYLVVIVPQSAQAPHQVTVGGDFRFYGRGAKGNRRLPEGKIARLYERRQGWQVDREQILREVIGSVSIAPRPGAGYIPRFRSSGRIGSNEVSERALEAVGGSGRMHQWLLNAAKRDQAARHLRTVTAKPFVLAPFRRRHVAPVDPGRRGTHRASRTPPTLLTSA